MTELMKRYKAETGKKATYRDIARNELQYDFISPDYCFWCAKKIDCLEDENTKLKAKLKAKLAEQTVEKFQEIIRAQCDEISALKSQLTWRPVSEKPEKDGRYFVRVQSPRGDISEDTTTYDKIYGWTCLGRRVVSWLPIPPAPEGE